MTESVDVSVVLPEFNEVGHVQPHERCGPRSNRHKEAATRARIAAYALHSKYDSRLLTAKARDRFLRRFLDEVDPERRLPEAERHRRAECARRAYFTRLALLSAKARARRSS